MQVVRSTLVVVLDYQRVCQDREKRKPPSHHQKFMAATLTETVTNFIAFDT